MGSGKAKRARRTKREADEKLKKEVWSMPPTIAVIGYPRSGTTTAMRMLYHGGIELITEDRTEEEKKRTRHSFWPYGDAEVKNIKLWRMQNTDPRITSGKAIKIISPYIDQFFLDRPVRAIFMLRDMNEIISSLLRMGSIWPMTPDVATRLARKVLTDLEIPTLYIHYHEMVKYPRATATQMADFLGPDFKFDIKKAIQAVDPNARTKMSDPAKEDLLTFHFDYMRDFKGLESDRVVPLSEDAKKTTDVTTVEELRKKAANGEVA